MTFIELRLLPWCRTFQARLKEVQDYHAKYPSTDITEVTRPPRCQTCTCPGALI